MQQDQHFPENKEQKKHSKKDDLHIPSVWVR